MKTIGHDVDGAQPSDMYRKKIISSLQSLVAIPILATSFSIIPFMNIAKMPPVAVLSTVQNRPLALEMADNKQQDLEEKAAKVDAYFTNKKVKLAGYGEELVSEAEDNGLPPYLLAAIAMNESTGGNVPCVKNVSNVFGWNSCDSNFASIDEAIHTVAINLGGNNPKTEKFYKDKDLDAILKSYNPPRVAPKYKSQVKEIMKAIEDTQVATGNSLS